MRACLYPTDESMSAVEEMLNNKRAKVQQQLQPLLALAGSGLGL